MIAIAYPHRKRAGTWHFRMNCTLWPTSDHVEQSSEPTTGELCNRGRS